VLAVRFGRASAPVAKPLPRRTPRLRERLGQAQHVVGALGFPNSLYVNGAQCPAGANGVAAPAGWSRYSTGMTVGELLQLLSADCSKHGNASWYDRCDLPCGALVVSAAACLHTIVGLYQTNC
jgi:hypothetical protein